MSNLSTFQDAIKRNVRSLVQHVTADTTVAAGDAPIIEVGAIDAAITITLPYANEVSGFYYEIRNGDDDASAVVKDGAGTTLSTVTFGKYVLLLAVGDTFRIIDTDVA